jgi:hypothetical protein
MPLPVLALEDNEQRTPWMQLRKMLPVKESLRG